MTTPLSRPSLDPTPIFEAFRGAHATEILTAAVAHFEVFDRLGGERVAPEDLRRVLGLERRPFDVLTTALRALGFLALSGGLLESTPLAREHLVSDAEFDVSGYVRLAAESPGVLELVERLRTNRARGADAEEEGAAYIFRDGIESAMERGDDARFLTLALAGRARNCAPALCAAVDLSDRSLLADIGGGSGIYSAAFLRAFPRLRAVVQDRPRVLEVAREKAAELEVTERMELLAGDMFHDELPAGADVHLLSNVLHDWDVPQCRELVSRCAEALPSGGLLIVHDVLLDDDAGGPLPIALYSVALFTLTEGRAYSAAEYRSWIENAGLELEAVRPTAVHCHALVARKP